MISTVNGDANVPFYKQLGNQGVKATDIPVIAFSVGEEELAGLDTKPLVGHLAAWSYFQSGRYAGEQGLHRQVARLHQEPQARDQRCGAIGLHPVPYVGAGGAAGRDHRRRSGSPSHDRAEGEIAVGLRGGDGKQPPHGQAGNDRRSEANGQFCLVYNSKALPPKAWSPYVEANKGKVADWSWPWVCGGCTSPRFAAN